MDKFSTKIISIENDSNNSRIQRDKTKDRRNATRRSFKCKLRNSKNNRQKSIKWSIIDSASLSYKSGPPPTV